MRGYQHSAALYLRLREQSLRSLQAFVNGKICSADISVESDTLFAVTATCGLCRHVHKRHRLTENQRRLGSCHNWVMLCTAWTNLA